MKQYIYIAISIFVFCVVVIPVYHKIIEPSEHVLKGMSQKFGPST